MKNSIQNGFGRVMVVAGILLGQALLPLCVQNAAAQLCNAPGTPEYPVTISEPIAPFEICVNGTQNLVGNADYPSGPYTPGKFYWSVSDINKASISPAYEYSQGLSHATVTGLSPSVSENDQTVNLKFIPDNNPDPGSPYSGYCTAQLKFTVVQIGPITLTPADPSAASASPLPPGALCYATVTTAPSGRTVIWSYTTQDDDPAVPVDVDVFDLLGVAEIYAYPGTGTGTVTLRATDANLSCCYAQIVLQICQCVPCQMSNEIDLSVPPGLVSFVKGKVQRALSAVPVVGSRAAAILEQTEIEHTWKKKDVCIPPLQPQAYDYQEVTATWTGDPITIPIPGVPGINQNWTIARWRLEVQAGPFVVITPQVSVTGTREVVPPPCNLCPSPHWTLQGDIGAEVDLEITGHASLGRVLRNGQYCCAKNSNGVFTYCYLFGCKPPGCSNTIPGHPPCDCAYGCPFLIDATASANSGARLRGAWDSCQPATVSICWDGLSATLNFDGLPLIGHWSHTWPVCSGSCAQLYP